MKISEIQQILGEQWVWAGHNHHFRKTEENINFLIFVAPNLVKDKLGLKFCKQCTCCNNITTVCIIDITTIQEFQTLLNMLKDFK